MQTKEFTFSGVRMNGFLMLFLVLLLLAGIALLYVTGEVWGIVTATALLIGWPILLVGFTKLEPNEAMVMLFFGKYRGVIKENGFFWVNPFMTKKRLSMRARNLNVDPIKVNDKVGNPVLIGLVLVWKLKDTYKAMFEIDAQTMAVGKGANVGAVYSVSKQMDALENFVAVQSDAALRGSHQYAHDNNVVTDDELTLRSGGEEINENLLSELNTRLRWPVSRWWRRASTTSLTPEIAAVMLRRQQAEAIISAREDRGGCGIDGQAGIGADRRRAHRGAGCR